MTASKRHKRQRKTFAATTRTARSFPISDGDSSDGPDRRRPPAPGWHGPDDDDDKDYNAPEGTDRHDGQAPSRSPDHPDPGQTGRLPPHASDGMDQKPSSTRPPTPSDPAPPPAADPPAGAPPRPTILRPPSLARRPGGNQAARRPQPRPSSAIAKHKLGKPALPKQDDCTVAPVRRSATTI
jgi:hypothetical protein